MIVSNSGKRHEQVDWLVCLCRADVRVLMAYAEVDPGPDYLNVQLPKGVDEQLRHLSALRTYAGLGHPIEGVSARRCLFRDAADFFADLDRRACPGIAAA